MSKKLKVPAFDDETYEDILKVADVDVRFGDEFVDGHGNVKRIPEYGAWAMSWEYGFITFDSICDKDQEQDARKAAAMFVYLWCNGIQASIAERLAESYVMIDWKVQELKDDDSTDPLGGRYNDWE